MDLLEWLTGSDSEAYSSGKPPEFLGDQKARTSGLSQGSPVHSTSVESRRDSKTQPSLPPQFSLTPLESQIKDLILDVYSDKRTDKKRPRTPSLSPTLDKQHKSLHILPSAESKEPFRLNLDPGRDPDLSVEIVTDEEESQTIGLGRLASSLPSSVLRASPVGSESLKLDSDYTRLPAHIKRPELPSRVSGRDSVHKLPVELDVSTEQELISRSTPEGISDSDTDLSLNLAPSSTSDSLTKHLWSSPQSIRHKDQDKFEHQSTPKMSDVQSLASAGSFIDEEVSSVPFFSANDRNVNPSDSDVPQVVPSMHQDSTPYGSIFSSTRDSGITNIPSALRPGSSAYPYSVDEPDSNLSLLYSFTDSSYKSKLSKGSSKPRSQVVESFGVSVDMYQPAHSKPAPVHVTKSSSVGDETERDFHFPKPRFVSESDNYPLDETQAKSEFRGDDGGVDEVGKEEEEENEKRSSSTPVFDTDNEGVSKEVTPVPELVPTLDQEPTSLVTGKEPDHLQFVPSGQEDKPAHQVGVDTIESPLVQPLPHQPPSGTDSVDAPVHLESSKEGIPDDYGEPHSAIEETKDKPLEEERQNHPLPLSLDAPSYRVSRLDSDVETGSVVSVQELTETLLSEYGAPPQDYGYHTTPGNPAGKVPFSLPLIQPQRHEGAAPSPALSHTSLPTPVLAVSNPRSPLPKRTARTPTHDLSSLPLCSKLPQHLQASPKLPQKGFSHLPAGRAREISSPCSEVSEGSSLPTQPVKDTIMNHVEAKRRQPVEERLSEPFEEMKIDDGAAQEKMESLEKELVKALQDKANLEGQLESVTEECKVTLKDRADLQSKLAKAETELAEMAESLEKERSKPSDGRQKQLTPLTAQDINEVKEDLVKTKTELEQEKETVAALKNELAREKQNARKLQNNLEWTKQSLDEQQSSLAELQDKVKDLQATVDKKSSELEEADAKLSSLEASYGALQGTKEWLHGQLENVLEEKKKLQEEWRESKANAVAQSMRAEQLLKENAAFKQQVADLQQGILQDKAKLVNELEAIEADVLSREDSYSHLVAEKAQLEDMVKRKEDVLEKLNSDLARVHVEKEELEKNMEDSEMRNDVLMHKVEDLERRREALSKKLSVAEQELDARSCDLREMEKTKSSLQERLKQLDAALISKDGTCQGLTDANDILKHELETIKQDRDQLEGELDKTKEEMAALEAELKQTTDSNIGKETEVQSMAQLREASTAETQALKERLAEKERELEEKANELESLAAQSGELLGQFNALQDQFHSIAADTGSMQDSVAEKDRVIAHLASEKDKAEGELTSLKEEAEQLKDKVTQLEHDNARLEGEIEASSSGNLEKFQKAVQDKAQLQAELNSLKLGQQQKSIRAQAKVNRLESDLKAVRKDMDKAQKELQRALKQKEEEVGRLEEEKLQVESALRDWKNKFEHAQRQKERLQNSVETQKPTSSTLEALTVRCEQLAQQNQALNEKLQLEASQRAEIERASGMVAAKLKQNAQEEEKKLQRQIRDLSLEMERLRGRLSGMNTTQSAMRDHAASLEAALAKRESLLVKLSAQAQKVLEEKELEDQSFASQMASLEKQIEDATKKSEAWKLKAQTEKKNADQLSQQLSQKEMELADTKALLEQTSKSGRSIPHLEEKIAELAIEKDDLLSQISGLKTQLTVARTAIDITKKDLTDRSSQVEILKKELDMTKAQKTLAESEAKQLLEQFAGAEDRHRLEVSKLREALQKERESSVMEESDPSSKPGLFEMSLSAIGTEDVDKARSGTVYVYVVLHVLYLYALNTTNISFCNTE